MKIVAVISPKGGVGKTTITANLGAAIAGLGGKVMVLDLDPQNSVRLHFGVRQDDPSGIARQALLGNKWRDAMFETKYGVSFLPYGIVSERDRVAFEHRIRDDPYWLSSHLGSLNLEQDRIVLIDTPPGPSTYLQQVLKCADLALVVLKADAASYSTIPAIEALIQYYCSGRADFGGHFFLIHQTDASRQLNRDVTSILRDSLGARLIPVTVHRDEAVSEALASQTPVTHYAPHSSATHDLQRVAAWLQTHFGLVA